MVTHWAATLVFKFSDAPMAEKDRAVNPLGFQVTEYRTDPDTAPGETQGASAAPLAPPAAPAPSNVMVYPGVPAQPTPTPAVAAPVVQP